MQEETENVFDRIAASHLFLLSIWHRQCLMNTVNESFAVHMLQQPHYRLAADCHRFNVFLHRSNFLQPFTHTHTTNVPKVAISIFKSFQNNLWKISAAAAAAGI